MDKNFIKGDLPAVSQERLLHVYGVEKDIVKVKPGNWILPRTIVLEKIKNFEIYEDDIWIVTSPKVGTTWMQEITYLIMNDVNIEKTKINLFFRAPFLEYESLHKFDGDFDSYPEGIPKSEESVLWYHNHSMEYTRRLSRPRIIKSHLPLSLLPENILETCKVIYVARNMKDVAVSYYYHLVKILPQMIKDFKLFATCFLNNETLYNPFIPHILEAWEKRNNTNMFFTTYEQMNVDLRSEVTKLVSFLRGPGYCFPDSKIETLLKHVDFESFRKNIFVNQSQIVPPDSSGEGFVRKGIIGDWKNHFDEDMNKDWDASIEKQLRGTDYKMIFEASELTLKNK